MITLEKINDKQVKISGDTTYVIVHSAFSGISLILFLQEIFSLCEMSYTLDNQVYECKGTHQFKIDKEKVAENCSINLSSEDTLWYIPLIIDSGNIDILAEILNAPVR